MTPEEWTQGIENEAEHTDDATWAAEARRHASRERLRPWLSGVLALAFVEGMLVLGLLYEAAKNRHAAFEYGWTSDPWADLAASWVPLLLMLLILSRLKLHPIVVGLVMAVGGPLLVWLTGVLWPTPPDPFPGSYLHAQDFFPRVPLSALFTWRANDIAWLIGRFLFGWLGGFLGLLLWCKLDRLRLGRLA